VRGEEDPETCGAIALGLAVTCWRGALLPPWQPERLNLLQNPATKTWMLR
jgi:hypothetical protein